uniref:E3 ubiquitin protein ligase n=1 Tax=Macrostomum lignano TaxID=282301 RepID=A0A1I8FQE8_9PLAT
PLTLVSGTAARGDRRFLASKKSSSSKANADSKKSIGQDPGGRQLRALAEAQILLRLSLRLRQRLSNDLPRQVFDATEIEMTTMESIDATEPEAADKAEDLCSYKLAASQASCWLRQLICVEADSTAAAAQSGDEESDRQEDDTGEIESQLESLYAQFHSLSANSQLDVPEHLRPRQLRQLRARQAAVSACLTEARSLDRRRQLQLAAERAAIFDKLRACRPRLELVAKCAARLDRNRPSTGGSSVGGEDSADGELDVDDESSEIDRDRRLVRDSAARARRTVNDLMEAAAKAKAAFSWRGRRLLIDCADCLGRRADKLEERGRDATVCDEDAADAAESETDEVDNPRMLARVETRLSDFLSGDNRRVSLAMSAAQENSGRIRALPLLLSFAADLCTDAERIAPTDASALVDLLHRKHRLEQLESKLAVSTETLNQLIDLTQARQSIRRELELRAVRLRHLRELSDAGGTGRFNPADFLAEDEIEAVQSTTRRTAKSAKLENLAGRIRDELSKVANFDSVDRLLEAEKAADKRRLKSAEKAMLALHS